MKNIYDIAKLANVSKSTVSRVINNHSGVSPAARARVEAVIAEHSYIPNNAARHLSGSGNELHGLAASQSVVLLVHSITNPFFARIIAQILDEMRGRGYDVILHSYEWSQGAGMADEAVAVCKEKRPKGLILLGGYFEEDYPKLQALGVPMVMVSATVKGGGERSWFSSIFIDDECEGERIAEFVCSQGHRAVGVIGQFYPREQGMSRVWTRNGVHPGYAQMPHSGASMLRAGYDAARELLDRGGYSCFVCLSDVLAIGAMKAIHERGLRVPEDISVVGFDGIESGEYTNPPLTTFVQPFDEMARKSAEILCGVINEGTPHRHEVLHTELNKRGSFRPL